jgi:hypothetical protein
MLRYMRYTHSFMSDHALSPAELCDVLDIAKSTLLRWEKEGQIPPAIRDVSGERRYGPAHIQAIAEKVFRPRYVHAAGADDTDAMGQLDEALNLCKFLQGSEIGLDYLGESPRLSDRTLKGLLSRALDLKPSEEKVQLAKVIRVVWKQVRLALPQQSQQI